jgi:hypothetical protein
MAARAEVHIKGSETVSTAAEKAAGSIHQLRNKVQESIQPMKDLAKSARDLLAFGGLAAGAAILYRGLSDMEKEFEKLNPQVALMPGSIKQFTGAADGLKAGIGGLISEGMRPLRTWLQDIFVEWTKNIKAAQDYRQALKDLETATTAMKFGPASAQIAGQIAGFKAGGQEVNPLSAQLAAAAASLARADAALAKILASLTPAEKAKLAAPVIPAVIPAWAMDYPAEFAGQIASIMRDNLDSIRQTELEIADAREMAAVEFARIMREQTAELALPTTDLGLWRGGGGGGEVEAPSQLMAIFDQLSTALGPIIASLTTLDPMMMALQIVFDSMMQVLQPVIDTLIRPLIGVFVILGRTIGQILVPVLVALTPIIELMGKQFIWLYNKVIMPVGNFLWAVFTNIGSVISWVIQKIVALGTTIWYIVSFQWKKLGTVDWGGAMAPFVNPSQGPLTAIDTTSLTDAGAGYQAANGNGASSNTTVQHPPDIFIYQTFQGPIVGAGGSREFAMYVVDAIKDYLGTGARVTFLEN